MATAAAAMINAAANPDGSGVATVGNTHSPQVDLAADRVATTLGISRVLTPVSASILDLIILDHNRLRALYDCYLKLGPVLSPENKQLLCWHMIMGMSEHAAKEELVLYPAMRAVFGDMEVDNCLNEHAQVKQLTAQVWQLMDLCMLDTMVATDPSFDAAVRASVEAMLAHIAEEEGKCLPRLGAALTPVSLLQLGLQFEAAKVRAPTRPHPEAPNLPPFNEASLAAAKQVDTALDQARMPSVVPAVVALQGAAQATPAPAAPPVTTPPAATPGAGVGGALGGAGDTAMEGLVTPADVLRRGGNDQDMAGEQAAAVDKARGMDKTAQAPGGELDDMTAPEIDAAV